MTETAQPAIKESGRKRRRTYARKDDVVLDAAENLFLEMGYANTSMDAVAAQADVSKRTVYSNFKNKQELFAAVIRKRCAEVLPNALDSVDLTAIDPEPALVELATRFLTSIFSAPQIQLYQTVVAASRRFPDIGAMMAEGPIKQSQSIFAEFFKAQMAIGNMLFPDADEAAAQLIALLKTNVHMRLMFSQKLRMTKKDIASSAASSIHLFLYGALPRKAAV